MVNFFSNNKNTIKNYVEKHYYYLDNIRKGARNVLLGYKFIQSENEDKDIN
jgi:hypothetical protein